MNIEKQVSIFRELFMGRTDVYGTYDPATGRAWQVKAAITDDVVEAHLAGMRPLGLYLLVKDTVWASVVDFDTDETGPPMEFVAHLRDVGLPGYVERSKSKGYHVWLFFSREGVKAHDARRLLNGVLAKMGQRNVEVFPKQDHLANDSRYGNFINLPLFGRLVPRGRTVFVDDDFAPVQDQWALLTDIRRVSAIDLECLDKSISANQDHPSHQPPMRANRMSAESASTYGLYPCAQKMLKVGVRANQRTACFRLASQLRKAGLPYEYAVVVLAEWARKNRPDDGRGIIKRGEIISQARWAYRTRAYRACGCDDPSVRLFCEPSECPIGRKEQIARTVSSRPSACASASRNA